MKRLLNEHTGTIHKPRRGTLTDETVCGALQHVPRRNVAPIESDRMQTDGDIDRCGRCFEDAGGY